MRIVSGIHRSRRLHTPKNNAVRPTSDKVRQAVFNMLHSRDVVTDAFVLDAFCGTGALGLEALSQGAAHCIFVDKSRESINMVRENITHLGEEEHTTILHQDVTKIKEKPTDIPLPSLVFLDPPYRQNLIEPTLKALSNNGWLAKSCTIVIEMEKSEDVNYPLLRISQEKIYGDTKIILSLL